MVLNEDNSLLPPITRLAEQCADISALWLYGSRATGEHRPESDYDLAAVFYTLYPQ